MAILAYDEVMLREPRLLVPGMQPLGLVKVDASWPYASALQVGYIASPGPQFAALSAGSPLINASGFYGQPHQAGMPIATSSTINYYDTKILAAPAITIVYGAILNAFSTDVGMFGVGISTTNGLRPGAWFDTSAGALRVGMSASGTAKFGTPFPTTPGTKVFGVVKFVWNGSAWEAYSWVNGAFDTSSTNIGVSDATASNPWRIFGTDTSKQFLANAVGWLHQFVFTTAFPDSLCLELSRDPYQLLAPA